MSPELPERCQYLLNVQHGVIARWQAPLAGLGIRSLENLVRYGRWQRLHRGIYAGFTGTADRQAQLWAAVLRVGSQAILSHETAAELAGLSDRQSQLIHVMVPAKQHLRPVPGIVVHRSRRIAVAAHPSLLPPQTVIEETVLDLTQEAAKFDEAFSWVSRACERGLTTPALLRMRMGMRKKMRWRDELLEALRRFSAGALRRLRDIARRLAECDRDRLDSRRPLSLADPDPARAASPAPTRRSAARTEIAGRKPHPWLSRSSSSD